MKEYIKLFNNHQEYEAFTQTDKFKRPNVSHCIEENEVHYNPIKNWKNEYLRTTALTNGTITFSFTNYVDSTEFSSISYSIDNGNTWTTVENDGVNLGVEVSVTAGNSILWKGIGTSMSYFDRGGGYVSCKFGSNDNCQFDVDGNIMSLLYGDNFANQTILTTDNAFSGIFANSNVVNAENLILPATTLELSCYATMFWQCTNLISAPKLPATTLASSCYSYMFYGCTSLTKAPELPATTLVGWCYYEMFYGCTSLSSITCLATDISETACTDNWVNGVASSGTFTKAASMSNWTTGVNGIPNGWTVETASE